MVADAFSRCNLSAEKFVRFGAENERTKAIVEMNGAYCSSRPMRIGVATPKNHLDINNSTLHKDWYWLEVVDMQMVPLPKVLSLMASPITQLYLLEGLILMSMRKTSGNCFLNLVKLSL